MGVAEVPNAHTSCHGMVEGRGERVKVAGGTLDVEDFY